MVWAGRSATWSVWASCIMGLSLSVEVGLRSSCSSTSAAATAHRGSSRRSRPA
ncbi:hypothetical protein ACFFX0_26640 [Citricoccus parietis]|uniref:Uncharacterized protein n=1 Tax=Citricoccus parietis TaxID=592307 RepID=A0ABV5G6I9_9MICC